MREVLGKTEFGRQTAAIAGEPIRMGRLAMGLALVASPYVLPRLIGLIAAILRPRAASESYDVTLEWALDMPMLLSLAGVVVLVTVRRSRTAGVLVLKCLCVAAAVLGLVPEIVLAMDRVHELTHPQGTSAFEILSNYEEVQRHYLSLLPWMVLGSFLKLSLIAAFVVFMTGIARTLQRPQLLMATLVVGLGVAALQAMQMAYDVLQMFSAGRLANLLYRLSGNVVVLVARDVAAVAYLIGVCVLAMRLHRKDRAAKT